MTMPKKRSPEKIPCPHCGTETARIAQHGGSATCIAQARRNALEAAGYVCVPNGRFLGWAQKQAPSLDVRRENTALDPEKRKGYSGGSETWASALIAEFLQLAHPASFDSHPPSENFGKNSGVNRGLLTVLRGWLRDEEFRAGARAALSLGGPLAVVPLYNEAVRVLRAASEVA